MALVSTIAGEFDESELDLIVEQIDRGTAILVQMEWRLKSTGEMVRRDALVNMKQGIEASVGSGSVG